MAILFTNNRLLRAHQVCDLETAASASYRTETRLLPARHVVTFPATENGSLPFVYITYCGKKSSIFLSSTKIIEVLK